MNLCKDCKYWGKEPGKYTGTTIDVRYCEREPSDVRAMKANEFAIICGHDGPIFCGPDFGCVNFVVEVETINEPA